MNNLEYIACPLCGGEDTKLVFKRKDLMYRTSDVEFPVVRCRHCSFVFVNPRPTAEDIHNYYPEVFYNTASTPEQTVLEKGKSLIGKYEKVKDLQPGKLLDIGCAKGEFMFMMKTKGWEVKGLDFSSKPPNIFNLDITYGDLETAPFEKGYFDLITMWAVLEHVYEPQKMLECINSLLRPGGTLVVLVTNFNSLSASFMRNDDVPRHVNLFTKKTVKRMLTQTGFEPVNYYFDQDVFGGSVRGALNFFAKRLAGETMDEILTQFWTPNRWNEFTSLISGKNSGLMNMVNSLDTTISPLFDRLFDALQLGFIMTVVSKKKENHSDFDITKAVHIIQPFAKDSGYAWKASIPNDNLLLGDNNDNPTRSKLILLENNKPMWKRHSLHADIRNTGKGRYSHWNNELLFSTSDNSNPNNNGRSYKIILETER